MSFPSLPPLQISVTTTEEVTVEPSSTTPLYEHKDFDDVFAHFQKNRKPRRSLYNRLRSILRRGWVKIHRRH